MLHDVIMKVLTNMKKQPHLALSGHSLEKCRKKLSRAYSFQQKIGIILFHPVLLNKMTHSDIWSLDFLG